MFELQSDLLWCDDEERLDVLLGQDVVPLSAVAGLHLKLAVQLHERGPRDMDSPGRKKAGIKMKLAGQTFSPMRNEAGV